MILIIYTDGPVSKVGHRSPSGLKQTRHRGVSHYLDGDSLKALDRVDPGDLRELVANLMVHHLRIAGKMDTVSWETGVRDAP